MNTFFAQDRILIIAEIGTAHNGSFDDAKKLIDAAAEAGADCVKFQWVYADEILHPDTGTVRLPGGDIRLYDRFKQLEMPPGFFADAKTYADSCGLRFVCSPFGLKSLKELLELEPFAVKIASPELNHFPLLDACNRELNLRRIPLILSSGVSTLCDIEKALEATKDVPARALLHCVTSYPAPPEEYNLNVLRVLSTVTGIPVGVSDHTLNPVLVPVLSAASGARVIEKHITLSREGSGLDDPVALTADDFASMIKSVRLAEQMPPEDTISMLRDEFGSDTVTAVLGTGKKELAPSERDNYTRTNRSIHFVADLPENAVIQPHDISVLRTEKVLTPGISPEYLHLAEGAVLAKKAVSGEGLTWEHLIHRQRRA